MLVYGFRITSWFLLLQFFISITLAFNVDTSHSIAYSGQPGTFFGYSVAMVESNVPSKAPTILIGAPKDNYNNTKFHKTGVLYTCKPTPSSCVSSRVNKLDKSLPDLTVQNASDAWIGGSISVNRANTKILTCGHRWKEWSKNDYGVVTVSMHGICYLNEIGNSQYELLKSQKVGGNAGMGKDAVFSKDGSEIILGAPGYNELAGAIITFKTTDFQIEHVYSVTAKSNSYTGYSVNSGIFFSDKLEYYVIGAPRYNDTGTVYIVSKKNAVKQELSYTRKIGAYFGASLCVTDIDGDGYDDLLVGAPLYSLKTLEGGAVMLYLSDGQKLTYSQTIWGMEMERGQFGTTIKDVGDIDKDGFHDIVIGAPYERNREGAIYIYNLGPNGFPANFSQKISGESVSHGQEMKGFGISVSRAVDINDDFYPDFLVGSYLSSQVRLLKSRPVLDLDFKATTTPERIDVNTYNCPLPNSKSICLDLELTVSYRSLYSYFPPKLDLEGKLYTEVSSSNTTSSSAHRALIKSGSKYGVSKDITFQLSHDTPTKLNFNFLIKDKANIFSPIEVVFDYKIRNGTLKNCAKLCPVMKGNQYKKLINYKLDCGPDKKCTSDLHLSMRSESSYIPYGKMQTFQLFVSVYNSGESAYNSFALFTFPSYVQYVQVTKTVVSECSLASEELVRCSLGNQIQKNSNVTFTLVFMSAGSLQENEIKINASVITKSEEKNPDDNQAVTRIPLVMKADITFSGLSEPNLLYVSKETSFVEHNFDIYNNGPSPLLNATISITLPELTEFVTINCAKSTLQNCKTKFPLEDLSYGERKLIKILLEVDADIFKKAKDIKSLQSTAKLTRESNSLYVDDASNWSLTAKSITNLQTEMKPIGYWVIIVSILVGIFVLALLVVILWKFGFFKRKKATDCDPLTNGEKDVEQEEEKDHLQESNGNTEPLSIKDEEEMVLHLDPDGKDVEV